MLQYLNLVLANFRVRTLRTFLTLIGIIVGITAVVTLISLGQGLQDAVQEQFAKAGSDKLYIQAKGSFGLGSSTAATITTNDADAVRRVRGIHEVGTHTMRPTSISLTDEFLPTFAGSIPDDQTQNLVIEALAYTIEKGRWPRKDERAVVLGNAFTTQTLLARKIILGNKIRINNTVFNVIGILQSVGVPDADQAVFMSQQTLHELFSLDEKKTSLIIARIDKGTPLTEIQDRVEHALRKQHNLKPGQEDFDVQTPDDLLATFTIILNIIQAVIVGIASISLLVGAIGITNTMLTAVLERTREIGIMKAVGARTHDVFMIFLIESGLLGLTGGIIGIISGMTLSTIAATTVQTIYQTPLLRASFPIWIFAGVLLFSLLVGIIAGVTPAYRASKLQPLNALRW